MSKFAVLFVATVIWAGNVHAEGAYVGGSVGFGDATLDADTGFDDSDDTLFSAKGFGGYRINRFLAVEGSLVAATSEDFEYDDVFDDEADVSFAAVSAAIVAIAPVDESFELFVKVGGFVGESEVDDAIFFISYDEDEEDESGLMWGGGAFFNFGSRKQYTIRAEFETYETDLIDDFWIASGGFQFNF